MSDKPRAPTLVNGELANVSATQIKTFRRCARAWNYEKVQKLPKKPPGKGAALGEKCHRQMEHWLKTGEDVRSPLVKTGHKLIEPYLRHAPFNRGRGIVEGSINLETPGGVKINGSIDFWIPGYYGFESPIVIDHKFKKDLAAYAETEEQLLDDEQAILYGTYALSQAPEGQDIVEFRHHNVQTERGVYAKAVAVHLTRDEIFDKCAALGKLIDGPMSACAREKDPLKVTPTVGHASCGAFGGCDFARVCPDSPLNTTSTLGDMLSGFTPIKETGNSVLSPAVSTEESMGLLDQLKQSIVAAGGTPQTFTAVLAENSGVVSGGAGSVTVTETVTLSEPIPDPKPAAPEAKRKPREPKAKEPETLTLLVDCFSSKATDITPWALDLAKNLAATWKLQDIRVAPKDSQMAYGGWRAVIAAEALKTAPTGVCYIARSELTEPVIEALSAVAGMVVRGRA